MGRNWGIPSSSGRGALRDPSIARPIMTLFVSAVFGVISAVISGSSFSLASAALSGLFKGPSVIAAVVAAGFGCWLYIWLARPRFAAQFSGRGDIFNRLLKFYALAAVLLSFLFFIADASLTRLPIVIGISLLCVTGGSAAAAAFQTVLAFVPYYDESDDSH